MPLPRAAARTARCCTARHRPCDKNGVGRALPALGDARRHSETLSEARRAASRVAGPRRIFCALADAYRVRAATRAIASLEAGASCVADALDDGLDAC